MSRAPSVARQGSLDRPGSLPRSRSVRLECRIRLGRTDFSGESVVEVPASASNLRRPMEPGQHAPLGVNVGEHLDPGTHRPRTICLDRAQPWPATLHCFTRRTAGREHVDLHDRRDGRLRLPTRHVRRNAPVEEQERRYRPAWGPEARHSPCRDALNPAARVAALPAHRWLHPALDTHGHAAARIELLPR